jgi:hypothetical protein
MHNEELHNLHASPNIIRANESRNIRQAGHVARMRREMYTEFWSEDLKERDRSERLDGHDNIRMDLYETGWEGVDWIRLAQDRDQ